MYGTMLILHLIAIPLTLVKVVQWTFKNHGKPFTSEDWGRLPKIGLYSSLLPAALIS